MTVVAAAKVLDQAVAMLSEDAFRCQCDVHDGVGGASLDELPAYHAHNTSWRARARLAGATIDMRSQAG